MTAKNDPHSTLPHNGYVLTEERGGVGYIKLNRPQALNSLNLHMLKVTYEQLLKWKSDDNIALICLSGQGEKGFCAGGDMRTLYDLRHYGVEDYAQKFFSIEYKLDHEIHQYPKPIVAYMDGIIMGGGVGLAVGASHRIVTNKTKWAMPEMNIGFFPDVGGSYFLNKMPGFIGRYLSLTGGMIQAADVLYIEAADYYIEREQWGQVVATIQEKNWHIDSAKDQLSAILSAYHLVPHEGATLASLRDKIDAHFCFDTMEEIVHSLKKAAEEGDEWASKTAQTLLSKSAIALKVTLRQLIEGQKKSLYECLVMEMELSMSFMSNDHFYEGVRSVLVDKDRSPKWNTPALEDVQEDDVRSFFHYAWPEGENPLK